MSEKSHMMFGIAPPIPFFLLFLSFRKTYNACNCFVQITFEKGLSPINQFTYVYKISSIFCKMTKYKTLKE